MTSHRVPVTLTPAVLRLPELFYLSLGHVGNSPLAAMMVFKQIPFLIKKVTQYALKITSLCWTLQLSVWIWGDSAALQALLLLMALPSVHGAGMKPQQTQHVRISKVSSFFTAFWWGSKVVLVLQVAAEVQNHCSSNPQRYLNHYFPCRCRPRVDITCLMQVLQILPASMSFIFFYLWEEENACLRV